MNAIRSPAMQPEGVGSFARIGVLTHDSDPVAESDVCNGPRWRHPFMHPVNELLIKVPGKVEGDE